MALWINLMCNQERIGRVEIRRREHLNISNPAAIQDAVSTYTVSLDGRRVGTVRHRYGDGAWRLLATAADLIANGTPPGCDPARVCQCTHRTGCPKTNQDAGGHELSDTGSPASEVDR